MLVTPVSTGVTLGHTGTRRHAMADAVEGSISAGQNSTAILRAAIAFGDVLRVVQA
jgi:hypothetical protein